MMAAGTIRERHIGIVIDNDDPQKRARIKVSSASLMGVTDNGEPAEYPVWIEPSFPLTLVSDENTGVADAGFFFVPNIGVAVEFEVTVSSPTDKSYGQSWIGNPDPRWITSLLMPGDDVASEFQENYPHRMGWKSRKGMILVFDDSDGNEEISLRGPPSDGGKQGHLTFSSDGAIVLESTNGHKLELKANGDIELKDKHGNKIKTTSSSVTITGSSKVVVDASAVELGANALESVIKGNTFQALFNSHTHTFTGNMGIPGTTLPPVIPLTGSELSSVTKTA